MIDPQKFESIHLTEIEKPENMKKHVCIDAKLTIARATSSVPHVFYTRCPVVDGKKQLCPARAKAEEKGEGEKFFCSLEKFSAENPGMTYEHKLNSANPTLLSAYQSKTETMESIVYYDFPCRVETFRKIAQVQAPRYLSVRECLFYTDAKILSPEENKEGIVDESGRQYRSQSLYYLTESSEILEPASSLKLFGQVQPHPRSQVPTVMVTRVEKSESDVTQFVLSEAIRDQFRKLNALSVDEFCNQLSAITQIRDRPVTHLLVMLVYHSALGFWYEGRFIKGTLDTLLLGDAGVGKTQILKTLIREIKLGQILTGSCSSRTGLSYSLSNIDKTWEIQWGAYPSNDRGLLVIDEGQDIPAEDWEKLSVGRSEGILSVDRVVRGEHPSRTRLVVLANPKSGRQVDSELYPCAHIKRIFTTKDIRRFDLAQTLTTQDVSRSVLLQASGSNSSGDLTSEILRNSVLYAWSRRPENISFQTQFNDELVRFCGILLSEYGSAANVPLVSSDIRDKLLRLSVAHSILRHNTDESGENILVTTDDLQSVVKILTHIYSHGNFGLGAYADTQKEESILLDTEFEDIKRDLIGDTLTQGGTLIKRKLIKLFAQTSELTGSELATSADLDRKTVAGNLSPFKNYGLITAKRGSGYKSTAKFNHFVRRLQNSGFKIHKIDQEDFMNTI